jgi:Right handed beta helix region
VGRRDFGSAVIRSGGGSPLAPPFVPSGGGPTPPLYYVDINSIGGPASDSHLGTSITAPWLTLAHAGATVTAGTILIRAGTYTGTGQTIDTSLNTVNSGTSSAPITWSAYPGNLPASLTPGPRSGAEVVIIQPPGSGGIAVYTPNTAAPGYLIFEDLIIDMSNQTVADISGGAQGIYFAGGSNYNQLIHLEVRNNGATGLQFNTGNGGSNYNHVLYCSFHDNGLDASQANAGYGSYSFTQYTTFQGNTFYSNHGYGMQLRGANNTIIDNFFHHNVVNAGGAGVGGQTGGGFNVIASGDPTADNNFMANNISYRNGYVLATGVAPSGTGATGLLIYSNENNVGCYFNTVYGNNGDGISAQYYDYTAPPIIESNISYGNAGNQIIDYGGINVGTGAPETPNAVISHNTTVNPLFVNPTATPPNLELQSGSPAIGAGLAVSSVLVDILGVTRASPPTCGAYEYPT